MKAVVFREPGGPEKLNLEECAAPNVGRGDALILVKACGLNHLDAWIIGGSPAYKVSYPMAPGTDVSGVVEAVGEGVTSVKPGDEVIPYPVISCGGCDECKGGHENRCPKRHVVGGGPRWGGYAEWITLPASILIKKPKSLDWTEAASIPVNWLTAWHMLVTLGNLQKGQTVLVMGAGSGVGAAAIGIASHIGARILTTASTPEKRQKGRDLGAEAAFDQTDPDYWKAVKDATHGKGVDVVFEHIGPAVWKGAVQSLAVGGTLVTCGATTGPEATLDLRYVFSKELTIKGAYTGTKRELEEVIGLFGQNKLKAVIDSTFPQAKAAEALTKLLDRKAFGKIVLTYS